MALNTASVSSSLSRKVSKIFVPAISVAICFLITPGLSTTAFAEDATGADNSSLAETGTQQDAPEGLLPVPDYSGNWKTRPYLSGTWGGTRQNLADKGFTFDVEWLQVGQGIVTGGRDTGWAYVTNLDYYAKLDLTRMDVLPGALISFRGQSRFGNTVNQDTGLLLPVNTAGYFPFTETPDEDVPLAITELNYLQFFSDKAGLLLGKITTPSASESMPTDRNNNPYRQVVPTMPVWLGLRWGELII